MNPDPNPVVPKKPLELPKEMDQVMPTSPEILRFEAKDDDQSNKENLKIEDDPVVEEEEGKTKSENADESKEEKSESVESDV